MYQRQEIFNIIELFTSQNTINFYTDIFENIDLSSLPDRVPSKYGPVGFSRHALFRAFIVMKCEKFAQITDLKDFLENNLIIAQLCGFDILKPLPSYRTFQRFIKNIENPCLKEIMKDQVNTLKKLGFIDNNFISVDATPVKANTKLNNPKCFASNKFSKKNHPKSDKDCKLGVHTANNSMNVKINDTSNKSSKKYEFYWGYKNHVICDAISGLPIDEYTSTADINEISTLTEILSSTNSWFSLNGSYVIADKGYDSKLNHNFIKNNLKGLAFIAMNKREKKNPKLTSTGNIICEGGLAMHKDGRQYFDSYIKQKFCCPFKKSKDDSLCPCKHEKYFNGRKNRGCVRYISKGTDYRVSINHESKFFKTIYSLRTESERYNSRWKNLNLESPTVRNINSITNLNTLGHITLLSLALAAIAGDQKDKIRSLTKFKKAL